MTFHDHKTFWLLIAVMIGVPSLLFVVALLKATTKDSFGVSGKKTMVAPEPPIAPLGHEFRHHGGRRTTHTIQFSAVQLTKILRKI